MIGGESDQSPAGVHLQPTGDYLYVLYNTRDDNLALWRFARASARSSPTAPTTAVCAERVAPSERDDQRPPISAVAAGDLRVEHTRDHDISGRVDCGRNETRSLHSGTGGGSSRERCQPPSVPCVRPFPSPWRSALTAPAAQQPTAANPDLSVDAVCVPPRRTSRNIRNNSPSSLPTRPTRSRSAPDP